MKQILTIPLAFVFATVSTQLLPAQEKPRTLMGMIAEWRYPDSEFKGAEMADGNTVNSQGKRTVPSLSCKTLMITDDDIDKVVAYYKAKLQPEDRENLKGDQPNPEPGQSVVFHDDSEGRPFAMHVITVNTDDSSTSLIITRGKNEAKTYIAWKQYTRLGG